MGKFDKMKNKQGLFWKNAAADAIKKLNPAILYKNPVMFTVEISAAVMLLFTFFPGIAGEMYSGNYIYNGFICLILFLTVLFGNFAESMAEAHGKALASSLRKVKTEIIAKIPEPDGSYRVSPSKELAVGDVFLAEEGDVIPRDGEIVEGVASIDESSITGESAPVIREAGTDYARVIGSTRVLTGRLKIKVTIEEGNTFLDKMIAMVEGASRQKTANEIALTVLLTAFTMVFLLVVVTLQPFSNSVGIPISIGSLIALFVCLIPTTIGGLLSAIGISGINRAMKANVIAKSGKAVEHAGDIDVAILDKTGTITLGNRKAVHIYPVGSCSMEKAVELSLFGSIHDQTPEGKSIVELADGMYKHSVPDNVHSAEPVNFNPATKLSGVNLTDGQEIRKGSWSAIKSYVQTVEDLQKAEEIVYKISNQGGTPIAVAEGKKLAAIIQLEDIIKPGITERFQRLRKMGVRTVMVTGDNPVTAGYIAGKAGVDEYIAEAVPEDKLKYIVKEQKQGRLTAMMGDGTNDAPALAQADVGIAMNSGTAAAIDAANMVDLDNDPAKILDIIEIGKQMLITRGNITTFSIVNDAAKYFAIIPALFSGVIPGFELLDIMNLHSAQSAVLSALLFNALIIPGLIPVAMKGSKYQPTGAAQVLKRNLLVYGLGGLILPFLCIKLIDLFIGLL